MFALGGAFRSRSVEDVILLFHNAYKENPSYALKCLFYLRDIQEGQGERRFFRICLRHLALTDPRKMARLIQFIPKYGRWDDLYSLVNTPVEAAVFQFIKEQLALDVHSKTPSLLAKWLKSENASSAETKKLGSLTRKYLNMSHKQYRKTLSILRERINVLERLMSAGKWDEIEFDKIPSKAGLIYRNAFARHDVERMKAAKDNVVSYADFAKDTTTKVNAKALYPYEVVAKVIDKTYHGWFGKPYEVNMDDIERAMVNKYWDNLKDYFNGATFNGLAVVDTSGSMSGTTAAAPINVAISLGLYCAEKASGPFAGHYISFASRPQLIKTEGVDFVDKVRRIYATNLVDNTNIEATFDLILGTAIANNCKQEDLPQNIIVISDMEFDSARRTSYSYGSKLPPKETLMESIAQKWAVHGYKMPHLVFWNVDARQNNVPMRDEYGITFVSGMSPVVFEMVMSGKTAQDLMYDKLNSPRYEEIY